MRYRVGNRLPLLLIVVVLAAGCTPSPAPPQQTSTLAADEAAIAEFNRRYLQTINEGDIDALASLTTDDHVMIGLGRAPLVGKQALVDSMTNTFQTFELEESWTPEETVISGDLAYQRGTWVVVFTPKPGGDPSRRTGHFVHIYRRQPDSGWLMVRDVVLLSDQTP